MTSILKTKHTRVKIIFSFIYYSKTFLRKQTNAAQKTRALAEILKVFFRLLLLALKAHLKRES